MKKGLLYLFMLVMSAVSFTSCSDDDPNWQKLPEEIKTENLNLIVNGSSTSGTVTLDVKNETAAVLNLQNIIPGIESVAIDVDLAEKEDGSFDFQGEKQVTGIQVRNNITPAYTVKVQGNVTTKGEMKATLTIDLNAASISGSVYADSTLKLTYSGEALAGKHVVFTTTDGQTASLTLTGIIPGDPQAVIPNITLTVDGFRCNFSGEATTAENTLIKYEGSVLGDTLTLKLNATLSAAAQGGLNGTWKLCNDIVWDENLENVTLSPFNLKWTASYYNPAFGSSVNPASYISKMANVMVSHILADVLHEVTFEADGNIKAQYFSTEIFSDTNMMNIVMGLMGDEIIIPEGRVWQNSPKNLAFWYTKNDKLYIIPDISMILQQVAKDGVQVDLGGLDINNLLSGLQTMTGEEIKELLTNLLAQYEIPLDLSAVSASTIKEMAGWLVTGIPLNYKVTADGVRISVDKEMVAPFMSVLLSYLPAIDTMLEEMASQPGGELISMLPMMTGVMKLAEISNVWQTTGLFDLGLEFRK